MLAEERQNQYRWLKIEGWKRFQGVAFLTVRNLTKLALLLALTLAFQMFGFPQPITGPAVNAMLILSTFYLGPFGGAIIGMLTPVAALMRGILAPPLGPAIPFIVGGNWAYVFAFAGIVNRNKYLALLVGAGLKFLILAGAVQFLLSVPAPVAKALQVPQLVTAVTGGAVALIVWPILQRANIK